MEQAPTPTFLLKLIRDWLRGTALMPINAGSRWPVCVAHGSQTGDGLDLIRGLLFPRYDTVSPSPAPGLGPDWHLASLLADAILP